MAPNKIWVDGDYVYETEAEARAETDDARLYIRADQVNMLLTYARHDVMCEILARPQRQWAECTCGLNDLLFEIRR